MGEPGSKEWFNGLPWASKLRLSLMSPVAATQHVQNLKCEAENTRLRSQLERTHEFILACADELLSYEQPKSSPQHVGRTIQSYVANARASRREGEDG